MTSMLARCAVLAVCVGTAPLAFTGARGGAQPEPLPSWNDGAAKKSITDFVARVT